MFPKKSLDAANFIDESQMVHEEHAKSRRLKGVLLWSERQDDRKSRRQQLLGLLAADLK